MLEIRHSEDRGHADHGWLRTFHTFSFAEYFDPQHVEFGPLRVINEDFVQPGTGFPTHGHRDMEIITYVLSGTLEHKDSMGNGSLIRPGDVQRMSAGRGVLHSEFNPSGTEPVHLLQIWIQPDAIGVEPGYEQTHFPATGMRGRLRLIASPDASEGSVRIHQDARVYAGLINGAEQASLRLNGGRLGFVQVARGKITANGTLLAAGDGLKLTDVGELMLTGGHDAEVLLFDLPA